MAHPRSSLTRIRWGCGVLLLAAIGCERPPSRPPAAAPPRGDGATTDGASDFASAPFATVRSARLELDLPLPDAKSWRIDDRSSSWLVARHAPTSSSVLIRAWREDDRMNRARCEERARLSRALPPRDALEVLERRSIDIPGGFDTEVFIGVAPAPSGEVLGGVAMAFGGWAHKCFAFVFTTSASGARAEELVGKRLAIIVQRTLGQLTFANELTPTIPRDPPEGPSPAR